MSVQQKVTFTIEHWKIYKWTVYFHIIATPYLHITHITVFIMPRLGGDIIGNIIGSLFIHEKYCWKLLCIACAGYLVIDNLLDYLIIRPTFSSLENKHLLPEDIPDILVCREVGFNHEKLLKYGYKKVSKYNDGVAINRKFVGWNGLNHTHPLRQE